MPRGGTTRGKVCCVWPARGAEEADNAVETDERAAVDEVVDKEEAIGAAKFSECCGSEVGGPSTKDDADTDRERAEADHEVEGPKGTIAGDAGAEGEPRAPVT